jgi:hypothetical protein
MVFHYPGGQAEGSKGDPRQTQRGFPAKTSGVYKSGEMEKNCYNLSAGALGAGLRLEPIEDDS